jgi:hypothetical protein
LNLQSFDAHKLRSSKKHSKYWNVDDIVKEPEETSAVYRSLELTLAPAQILEVTPKIFEITGSTAFAKSRFGWSTNSSVRSFDSDLARGSSAETYNQTTSVGSLIALFRRELLQDYRDQVLDRLIELRNASIEEEPSRDGLSINSLLNFLAFLRNNPKLLKPILTLTPDGDIYASWKANTSKIFSLRFLDKRNIRFVLFKPNTKHPELTERISGSSTSDTVLDEYVRQHEVDWVVSN